MTNFVSEEIDAHERIKSRPNAHFWPIFQELICHFNF